MYKHLKFFSLIALPFIFAPLTFLTACEGDSSKNGNNDGGGNTNTPSINISKISVVNVPNTHTKAYKLSSGDSFINIGANIYIGEESRYTFELGSSSSDFDLTSKTVQFKAQYDGDELSVVKVNNIKYIVTLPAQETANFTGSYTSVGNEEIPSSDPIYKYISVQAWVGEENGYDTAATKTQDSSNVFQIVVHNPYEFGNSNTLESVLPFTIGYSNNYNSENMVGSTLISQIAESEFTLFGELVSASDVDDFVVEKLILTNVAPKDTIYQANQIGDFELKGTGSGIGTYLSNIKLVHQNIEQNNF
jgi:hypothetical protein